jgi:hypothetical protein
VSGALLASAGFVWPGAAPFVGCCCWHVYCWPDYWSGCSSCSPSKKCLEKRCINISESNCTPKLYAMIFNYLYLSDEVMDKVLKQSHDSHQALTSMQQNIHTTQLMPGRNTAARAPVSRPPSSPRSTPPPPHLGRRPWTPEWPEAEAPASPVPPSTAGPPWTGVPVVHDPVDPVYGISLTKLIR